MPKWTTCIRPGRSVESVMPRGSALVRVIPKSGTADRSGGLRTVLAGRVRRQRPLVFNLTPGRPFVNVKCLRFSHFQKFTKNVRTSSVWQIKVIVGLDIGSSAVKAVELKAVGKGYKVAAFGNELIPPDSIVDGAIIDGGVVSDAIGRLFEERGHQDEGCGRVAVRERGHRQEDHAAADDRCGAGGIDLLGGPSGTAPPYSHATSSPATELVQMRVTRRVVRQETR